MIQAQTSGLAIHEVSIAYAGKNILDRISLNAGHGEFLSLLGSSGCGKTTLLRLLAGLEAPQTGEIHWNGEPLRGPSVERGIVFQEYSLFPWFTLLENVAQAVRKTNAAAGKAEARGLAEDYLELVGLHGQSKKYPHELSGGMRQRGAIARTLALGSPLLLLDEPFGALDPVNRMRLQDLLLEVWNGATPRRTVVFVTHDIEEAIYLGDRVIILGAEPGRVIGELTVPFPRPRVRETIYEDAEFRRLRDEICGYYHRDIQARLRREREVEVGGEGI